MENTATVPTGLDVSRLLKSQSLSASMRTNLARADIDNDGIIDVEELVKILESESALRRERKLLHWIVVALGIACILIVVAVVGLTYAVVHLSKDTAVQNNVLVSKADSQPLSTGSLQVSSALKDLYKVDNLAQLQGLDQIMMPFEDGISLFGIEGVHLVPGKSVKFDTNRENLTILVTEDGISVSGGSSNSTGRRRLLATDEEIDTIIATGTAVVNMKKASQSCDSNGECASNACGRATADDGAALVCCPSGATSTYGGYDYCTGMAVGATCWADDQCQTGKCKGNGGGTQKGSCSSVTKAVGEACDSNYECDNKACGRSTADDGAKLVCCESGATSTYGGYDYCTGMAVGATCWADDQCQTGKCKGNGGGTQKGSCSSVTKAVGEACDSNYECDNKACGRSTADDGAKLVCCESGATSTYGGYDYCTGMAVGATCWADDQCQSKYCQGNGGGLQRGKCQSTSKSKGESCSKDEECGSKACGRQTAADNAPLVCCDALESWAGYDYCNNMPAGSVCWSDDQCVSSASNCKGNGYGIQRGICS